MNAQRIKFDPIYTQSSEYNSQLIKLFLEKLHTTELDINIILECHGIIQFIKHGISVSWDKDIVKELNKLQHKYINTMNKQNFNNIYNTVEPTLQTVFWEFFDKNKLYRKIDRDYFETFLITNKPDLEEILYNKDTVKFYDEIIVNHLKNSPNSIEAILSSIELNTSYIKKEIYIPKSLRNEGNFNCILEKYINSVTDNMNFLHVISTMLNKSIAPIDDKVRLKAKRKLQEREYEIFSDHSSMESSISIKFIPDQNEVIKIDYDNLNFNISYDSKWINNNLDFGTLLNNFIYLFEFVDSQMRIKFTSKKNDSNGLLGLLTNRYKNHYTTNTSFTFNENLSNLQLYAYISILDKNKIRIEDIFSWFFNTYLLKHFDIGNFNVNFPSKSTTFLEKCRIIAPEIESILRKYSIYMDVGYIDYDLLCLSSKPQPIANIKCLSNIKYIYINPVLNEYKYIYNYLFSDQSLLNYISSEKKNYKSFYSLLCQREVKLSDYTESLHIKIEWLEKHGFVNIDSNGIIRLSKIDEIMIYKELYSNEVISFDNYYKKGQEILLQMLEEKIVYSDQKLFSKLEQDYLNYYLNMKDFGNSLDLRNMYLHGTSPGGDSNSDLHKTHYYSFIKIVIMIIIKINDDLCCTK